MTFDWFNLFNLDEFLELDLVSRNLEVSLETYGEKEVLITVGNVVSLAFEDVLLTVDFEGENPFVREGDEGTYAVYKDSNNDIWLGIEVAS